MANNTNLRKGDRAGDKAFNEPQTLLSLFIKIHLFCTFFTLDAKTYDTHCSVHTFLLYIVVYSNNWTIILQYKINCDVYFLKIWLTIQFE